MVFKKKSIKKKVIKIKIKKDSLTLLQIKIIRMLALNKIERNVSKIAKATEVTFPTAKKHLNELVKKKVLIRRKKKTDTFIGHEWLYKFDFEEHKKRKKKVATKKKIVIKNKIVKKK